MDLAKLFSGAFLSVVLMAGSLELGKLVTASFLYRYWESNQLVPKSLYDHSNYRIDIHYISRYLWISKSNAYQGATLEFEKQSTELIAVEERIEQLEEDKVFLKRRTISC